MPNEQVCASVAAIHLTRRARGERHLERPSLQAHLEVLDQLAEGYPSGAVRGTEYYVWNEYRKLMEDVCAAENLPAEWVAALFEALPRERIAVIEGSIEMISALLAQPAATPEMFERFDFGVRASVLLTVLRRQDLNVQQTAWAIEKLCSEYASSYRKTAEGTQKMIELTPHVKHRDVYLQMIATHWAGGHFEVVLLCPDAPADAVAAVASRIADQNLSHQERQRLNGLLVRHRQCPVSALRATPNSVEIAADQLSELTVDEFQTVAGLWDTWDGPLSELLASAQDIHRRD